MLKHWINWVWYAATALQGALLIQLLWARLAAKYPWFFAWICLELMQSLGLMAVESRPSLYGVAWIASSSMIAVLEVGATWEVFSLRTRQYGGVKAFGRGLLALVIVVALVLALFLIGPELRAPGLARLAKTTAILKRTVDSSLALFLIAAGSVFLFFHETPVARNVVRHFRILGMYFTAVGAGFLAGNLFGKGAFTWVNLWFGLITVVCFTLWIVAFRSAGENTPKLGPSSPEERARLEQLDAQLSDLLKSVKF